MGETSEKPMSEKERILLTLSDMQAMTGYSKRTVLRMSADGDLPRPVVNGSRRRRWSKRAVQAWLERRERASWAQ